MDRRSPQRIGAPRRGSSPARWCSCCRAAARSAPTRSGVYEALHEAGIEPDWVIGTSIGAINAALIAGNAPEKRLERLRAFWRECRAERRCRARFDRFGRPMLGT